MLRKGIAVLSIVSTCTVGATLAYASETFELAIPSQSVAEAAKSLSYATRHSVLFRTDALGDARTHPINGSYSLEDALERILKGTNLQGGLTESGVIVISQKQSAQAPILEGTTVGTKDIKKSLLAGTAGILLGTAPQALAQTTPDVTEAPIPTARPSTAVTETGSEIIVTGRQLDQSLAIAAKRDAKRIIDTITADQSSRLPDNNIVESLGRIPGVSFLRDTDTGDGTNISIRGLDAALNNIQFDGINAATSGADGTRRVGLEGISADDIAELRVAKSLLPEDEGEGIGGAVKIITKTPLQRGEDRLDLGIEGRAYDFNDKEGFQVNAGATKIFNENFGVNISGSFRRREILNYRVNGSRARPVFFSQVRTVNGDTIDTAGLIALNDAQNAADAANGDTSPDNDFFDVGTLFNDVLPGQLDPDALDFTTQAYSVSEQTRDTLNLSGAIDWQVAPSTLLTLGGRYNNETREQDINELNFSSADEDYFLRSDGVLQSNFTNSLSNFSLEVADRERTSASFYLKGKSDLGRLKLDYQASYSLEDNDSPDSEINFQVTPAIRDILRNSSRAPDGAPPSNSTHQFAPFTYVDNFFPVPSAGPLSFPGFVTVPATATTPEVLFPSLGELLPDINNSYESQFVDVQLADTNENDRIAFRFDGDYDVDRGIINSVKFGAKYERSDTNTNSRRFGVGDGRFLRDGTFSAIDLDEQDQIPFGEFQGITTSEFISLDNIGNPLAGNYLSQIPSIDRQGFRNFVRNFTNTFDDRAPASFTIRDLREEIWAGYAQAELEIEKLSIIGGIRVEHYDGNYATTQRLETGILNVDNRGLEGGARTRIPLLINGSTDGLAEIVETSSNTQVLPRINATYEIRDDILLRAGFGYSLARPSLNQLSQAGELDFDINVDDAPSLLGAVTLDDVVAQGGLPIENIRVSSSTDFDFERGNPNLKPAKSRNIDLSLEWYPRAGTSFSIGAFHKEIDNFIFINNEPDLTDDSFSIEPFIENLSPAAIELFAPFGGLEAFLNGPGAALIDVSFQQPQNGDTATVQGIELGANHQFDWAPGILKDMGFSGNITFTDSDAELPGGDYDSSGDLNVLLGVAQIDDLKPNRQVPFFNSPPITANATLYYDANGLDIAVSYSYQDHSFNGLALYGLSDFDASYEQWDFAAAYDLPKEILGAEVKVYFEVPDFTDGGLKPTAVRNIGEGSNLIDLASFNGREYRFGIRAKF